MIDYTSALEVARAAALEGGRIALRYYRNAPTAERKSDGTWVTEADLAVEAAVRDRIARAFPGHNILGEEEGLAAASGGPARPEAPTWIVDPIDATNNFIAGIPIWATLVALRDAGASVAGVCHAPALGETYDGAYGAGARCNGDSIRVDDAVALADATVVFGGDKHFRHYGLDGLQEALVEAAGRTRGFGDFWGHMLVARGAAHVMVDPVVSLWDVAALEPIVSEAGGRITGVDGRPWRDGACISAATSVHESVLALARERGAR